MDGGSILLSGIFLFFIIYGAVRMAVDPLLHKPGERNTGSQNLGLIKLRDIGVLSYDESNEIVKIYNNKNAKQEGYEQYQRYLRVLNELKEMGYFTDEQYSSKAEILKKHFKID